MPPSKRKHDELDSEDEDSPSYGKQILPVANLPGDFDEVPTDGLQYLFTVRRAARQLPDVVRVPNPFEMDEIMNTDSIKTHDTVQQSVLPSEDWRELFEYRFLNFQKNFDQPTIHVGSPNNGSRQLIPDKKDRDIWWAFLQGKPIPVSKSRAKRNRNQGPLSSQGMRAWPDQPSLPPPRLEYNDEGEVEQVLRVDPADSLPSPAGTPVPIPLECVEEMMQPSFSRCTGCSDGPREPTTALLKLIDGKTALHLLMYFTHWIQVYLKAPHADDHVLTESHARWMFALLSRVEEQVSADDMNLLRNLARGCIGLLKVVRGKGDPLPATTHRMGEMSCWFIVTIIAGVWKQRDLWSDAEMMLCRQ